MLLNRAFNLLLEAAEGGHMGAREAVSTAILLNDGAATSIKAAFVEFSLLAEEGSARGQWGLSFMHSTGLHPETKTAAKDKSFIYLKFAALSQDLLAQMSLGYRYWAGVEVEENCENALVFYHRVASHVAELVNQRTVSGYGSLSTGPGVHRVRLSDEADSSPSHLMVDQELLDYFHLMAEQKNSSAQIGLGQLYYQGRHGVEQNHDKAFEYFEKAAKQAKADPGNVAMAQAYLGEMLMAGTETRKPDPEKALEYLNLAIKTKNPIALTVLGLAHLHGRGNLNKDPIKALQFFVQAADQGYADAQLQLGIMFLGNLGSQTDFRLALKYLTLASQQGNLLALFHLGMMHAKGMGVLRSCPTAAEFFKNVAERGRWSLLFNSAYEAFQVSKNQL
ncbi:Protein sel-1 1 [Cichlidogyrus casuarinus]|uniref:Protein sel-1 1 n=1 Tax=Cichlidogyrus casuarinus TaxID=1844966 RepID=A0ABD2Q016_9PLAT